MFRSLFIFVTVIVLRAKLNALPFWVFCVAYSLARIVLLDEHLWGAWQVCRSIPRLHSQSRPGLQISRRLRWLGRIEMYVRVRNGVRLARNTETVPVWKLFLAIVGSLFAQLNLARVEAVGAHANDFLLTVLASSVRIWVYRREIGRWLRLNLQVMLGEADGLESVLLRLLLLLALKFVVDLLIVVPNGG